MSCVDASIYHLLTVNDNCIVPDATRLCKGRQILTLDVALFTRRLIPLLEENPPELIPLIADNPEKQRLIEACLHVVSAFVEGQ
jgi:hypothetical protein